MEHFADRWFAALDTGKAPVCVGLDPMYESIPGAEVEELTQDLETEDQEEALGEDDPATRKAAAMFMYCLEVLELVAPLVPAVKINSGFFEAYQAAGVLGYHELVKAALERELLVIGDVKRADIGHSSRQYALGHLSDLKTQTGFPSPDAVTVNPYFGIDGVEPFLEIAQKEGRGVFVLAQTSTPSAAEVQGLRLADGRCVREAVAGLIDGWSQVPGRVGSSGYSCVGAVVSPTDAVGTRRLREIMPRSLFLVPGIGAQGRSAEEAAACFDAHGGGAMVASSRGVMYPWTVGVGSQPPSDWRGAIAGACRSFIDQVRAAVPGSRTSAR